MSLRLRVVEWFACIALGCGPGVAPIGGTESEDDTGSSTLTSDPTTLPTITEPTSTTGECPTGTPGCPCTAGGVCDSPLVCIDSICALPDCPVGSEGCPCTGGGGCDVGLECSAMTCVDPGGTLDTGSSGDTATTGSRDLDDWAYRRAVTVNNGVPVELDDFQVLVAIDYDEDMNGDFSDLRFADQNDGMLPHWIEHSLASTSVEVWVRVPSIPAGDATTIYVYYGNPAAESASDGDATFSFFDDFPDDLDAAKWSATGDASVSNGRLFVETGAVYSNDHAVEPNEWVEALVSWANLTSERTGVRFSESQGWAPMGFYTQDAAWDGGTLWCSVCDPDGNCPLFQGFPGGLGAASENILGMAMSDDTNFFALNRGGSLTSDSPWATSSFLSIGHPLGSEAGIVDGFDVIVDWILVRKWADEDPTTSVGAEEPN